MGISAEFHASHHDHLYTVYGVQAALDAVRIDDIEFNAQVPASSSLGPEAVGGTSFADQRSRQRGTQDVRLSGDGVHRCNCLPEPTGSSQFNAFCAEQSIRPAYTHAAAHLITV